MSDTTHSQAVVSTAATATVRQRPALLLMILRVRAAEATLELGLARVKPLAADAARRLKRLGAGWVSTGEPHADDHANPDPAAKFRAAALPRRRPTDVPAERPGVNIVVAATWDLAGRSPEEALLLVDQLRFDAAADAEPPEPDAELSPDAGPMEQFQQIQQMVARTMELPDDRSPKFLYLARLTDEQLGKAAAEAFGIARRRAEVLAAAAGRKLGEICSLSWHPGADGRPDKMMEQQRCLALLSAAGYTLAVGEVVSEDPRTTEVTVIVHSGFQLV